MRRLVAKLQRRGRAIISWKIFFKISRNGLEQIKAVYDKIFNSFQHDVDPLDYTKNQAGFHHSHKYGFGLMDSWRLVNLAKVSIVKAQ